MAAYNAIIHRNEEVATLILEIGDPKLNIVLTEDNPIQVKTVFNKLLEHLKKGEVIFDLKDEKEDLYFYICKEYITQLNVELASIFTELQDNGLLETSN